MIKERDDAGRVTGTRKKAIFGEEERLLEIFEEHTAYVERTHLTMRQMNSRLVRKGLGFSKELPMHRQCTAPGSGRVGRCRLQPNSNPQEPSNRSNRPTERPAWTTLEEAHACNGGWTYRSGVVDREAAPNRADHQHIIGPPPFN